MDRDQEVEQRLKVLEAALMQLADQVARVSQQVNALQLAISGATITLEGPESALDNQSMS